MPKNETSQALPIEVVRRAPKSTLPSRVEESLLSREKRLQQTPRLEIVDSHRSDVSLIIEPGVDGLNPHSQQAKSFVAHGLKWFMLQSKIAALAARRDQSKKKMEDVLLVRPDIRGLQSEKHGFRLVPARKAPILFRRPYMEDKLGKAFSAVAKDTVMTTLIIPSGTRTKEGDVVTPEWLQGQMEGFLKTIIDAGAVEKLVNSQMKTEFDLDLLTRMVKKGKLHLGDEAAEIGETNFSFTVGRLPASRKKPASGRISRRRRT